MSPAKKTPPATKSSKPQPKKPAGKPKPNTKVLQTKKRQRRQWITFMRMIRYGVNNFTRNAWLTVAATAVMTITLMIIFVTVVAGSVLNDSIKEMTRKIDMSLYVKTDISEVDVDLIKSGIEDLTNTESVSYISPEQGKSELAQDSRADDTALDAITEATNRIPGTFRVQLHDIENTSELEDFVNNNSTYRANQERKPTFVTRKDTIETLTRWAGFAQRGGIVASSVFVLISSLIIFNTIRMAIFSRKDEINMMKLIGAERNFIRGPFVVEAIVYGFIAGVVATIVGFALVVWSKDGFSSFGIVMGPTFDWMVTYAGLVLLGMIVLGGIIGTISALFATRRYLKV